MTHFVVLIIVPAHIYILGDDAVKFYITAIMTKYDENYEVAFHIYKTVEVVKKDYEEFDKTYNSIKEFYGDNVKIDTDGNLLSTHNPNSLYDYWMVGGRWSCLFLDIEGREGDESVENNSISVKQLLANLEQNPQRYTFNIIIDRTGKLHSSRNMGWWGSYEKTVGDDEWVATYKRVLENTEDGDHVVNLDCHI